MRIFKILTAIACAGLLASPAFAHHSTKGIYQDDVIVEKTGVVKSWRFINPHPYFTIEVTEDGEVHEYDVSYGGAAVVHLQRRGYTAETFKPGETIIVEGHPARAQGVYGLLIEGRIGDPKRADGTPVVPPGGSNF